MLKILIWIFKINLILKLLKLPQTGLDFMKCGILRVFVSHRVHILQIAINMAMIHASDNRLESLPKDLRNMPTIDSMYFDHNNIKSLNGALQKARNLKKLNLSFNKLKYVSINICMHEVLIDGYAFY